MVESVLGPRQCFGWTDGEAISNPARLREQLIVFDHLCHETESFGLRPIDGFVGQKVIFGFCHSHQ